VPSSWRSKPDAVHGWIKTALERTRQMPPKVPSGKKSATKKPAR
jgi:hypothetical protein